MIISKSLFLIRRMDCYSVVNYHGATNRTRTCDKQKPKKGHCLPGQKCFLVGQLYRDYIRVGKFHALLILHNTKVLLKERQQLIDNRLLLLSPITASEA